MGNLNLSVIGGGLTGCEAAWQAAERGVDVTLYEMRPVVMTDAHKTDHLAELVCSNSLGTTLADRGSGLLIKELELLNSMLIQIALENRVPAGSALAVDREKFSLAVSQKVANHPKIRIIRQEIDKIPEGACVVASGPLTSPKLSTNLSVFTGSENLFFFDAIAPIIAGNTIDREKIFSASRYDRGLDGNGDYWNCPLTKNDYDRFVSELINADCIPLKSFENNIFDGVKAGPGSFFEGCLPIEQLARRGEKALAFGPMRPSGLTDPRTGRWPYALVQLRRENTMGDSYNLVGFQTNLTYEAQERIFRMIPGLEQAEFLRYGQMHRNTYLNAPRIINPTLQAKDRENLFFAGQLAGVEGYAGNIASGLVAGINAKKMLSGEQVVKFPDTTMIGSLLNFISHAEPEHFQPMKANFGLLPDLPSFKILQKRERYRRKAERAIESMSRYIVQGVL